MKFLCSYAISAHTCRVLPSHLLDSALWEKAAVNAYVNSLSAILDCSNAFLAEEGMENARWEDVSFDFF